MIHNHISIRQIISKIYRDLRLNQDIPESDLIEWAGEALLFIGTFRQFSNRIVSLDVDNYKTPLPKDFYKFEELTYHGEPMVWRENSLLYNKDCKNCTPTNQVPDSSSYFIRHGYIYTPAIQSAIANSNEVCLNYMTIPVDDDGYPTVPDDVYYINAVSSYIISKLDYIEWRKGRIADKVYQDGVMKWEKFVNAARGAANMPDASQMENLKNILMRLTPLTNEYLNNWRNLGTAEKRYRQ
jgi:hypothetical protein